MVSDRVTENHPSKRVFTCPCGRQITGPPGFAAHKKNCEVAKKAGGRADRLQPKAATPAKAPAPRDETPPLKDGAAPFAPSGAVELLDEFLGVGVCLKRLRALDAPIRASAFDYLRSRIAEAERE